MRRIKSRGIGMRGIAGATIAMLFAVLVVAGCGESDDSDSSGSDSSSELSDVKERVDKLLTDTGTYEEPPADSPEIVPDKKVGLISCGQNITSCANPIDAAQQAAEAVGWEAEIFDSKGDYANANDLVRSAIVGGADAIFVYYIDCRYMQGALKEAAEDDIPVVAAESFDCDYESDNEPLWTGEVTYVEGDYNEWNHAYGQAGGDYAVNYQDGKAQAVMLADDSGYGSITVVEGWEQAFDPCADCKLVTDYFPISAFDVGFQQRTQQLLLKNPDTNTVAGTYEAIILAGVESAVRSQGGDQLLYVGEGGPAGMDLVRSREAPHLRRRSGPGLGGLRGH